MRVGIIVVFLVALVCGVALSALPWGSGTDVRVWHRSYFLDPAFYAPAYAKLYPEPFIAPVIAGTVPHHLLATSLLASFYENLGRTQQPSVVVIIGPDHLDRSGGNVVTSAAWWQTPYGVIPPASEFADALVSDGLAQFDEPVFGIEHSITVETAFLSHAFPNASILPITTPSRMTDEAAVILGTWLNAHLPHDALLLVSTDFSHEVTSEHAQAQDRESIRVLMQSDQAALSRVTADDREALRTMLVYTALRNATRGMLVANENASTVTGTDFGADVTSYVLMTLSVPGSEQHF